MSILKRLFRRRKPTIQYIDESAIQKYLETNIDRVHVVKSKPRVKRAYGKKIETEQDASEYMQYVLNNWPAFCEKHRKLKESMQIAIRALRERDTFLLTVSSDSLFNAEDLEDENESINE